ncbi:MAG: hypothetical protein OXF06_13680 [Bacteroidetes bacterium]|nr:hypothetical protein [Bacteroidota bacterium]MCY4225866.1 hypothetical protein [Bacteroidota bacterium]
MSSQWSIVAGMLLGFGYIGTSILVTMIAQRTTNFVPVVLGGMVLRMIGALLVFILIISMVPVVLEAFTATFLLIALTGLFVEILWISRRKAS